MINVVIVCELLILTTQAELESVPLMSIMEIKAVLDRCAYNSLLAVTVQERGRRFPQVFLFQCEETGVSPDHKGHLRTNLWPEEGFRNCMMLVTITCVLVVRLKQVCFIRQSWLRLIWIRQCSEKEEEEEEEGGIWAPTESRLTSGTELKYMPKNKITFMKN